MRRIFILFIIYSVSLSLTQCATKKAATTTAPDKAAVIGEIKRNFTAAQMEEGKMIWQSSCNRCHKLYQPESHKVADWENILIRMNPKAKLDETQAGKVRAYILTNAKDANG